MTKARKLTEAQQRYLDNLNPAAVASYLDLPEPHALAILEAELDVQREALARYHDEAHAGAVEWCTDEPCRSIAWPDPRA